MARDPIILVLSVLKSADDIRGFHKLGRSLSKYYSGKIYSVGQGFKKHSSSDEERLVDNSVKGRNIWSRMRGWQKAHLTIKNIHPDILLLCSPELIPLVCLHRKKLKKSLLILDLQEDYITDLRAERVYKGKMKNLLVYATHFWMRWAAKHFHLFILAEACYEYSMLPYEKLVIMENKVLASSNPGVFEKNTTDPRIALTGTLSNEYGLTEALRIGELWHKQNPKIKLILAGKAKDKQTLCQLEEIALKNHYCKVISDLKPVDYNIITKVQNEADLLLLPYPNQGDYWDCMPTRMFEGLALKKVLIIPNNPKWKKFLQQFNAEISMDFHNKNSIEEAYKHYLKRPFYNKKPVDEVYWVDEEKKLFQFLDKLEFKFR